MEHGARLAQSLDPAGAHHHQQLRKAERFRLIVRDIDRGEAEPVLQLFQLEPDLVPQQGIEVGQRLVEQHQPGLVHQGAGQRHTLLLAAGQLRRRPVDPPGEPHLPEHPRHPFADLGLRHPAHPQRQADVAGHRHVRPDGIGLEHDAEFARFGRQVDPGGGVEHHLAADPDHAGIRRFQPGQAAQHRRLAAPAGAEQRGRTAFADGERNPVQRRMRSVAFDQPVDLDEPAHRAASCPNDAPDSRNAPNAVISSMSWITASAAT